MIIGRQSEGSIIRGFVNHMWVSYSQRYLFNAIPDTNHNANPTNPNRYSKGNPNPTNPTNPTNPINPTNPNTRYRIIGLSNPRINEPSDYRYITLWIPSPIVSKPECTVASPGFVAKGGKAGM